VPALAVVIGLPPFFPPDYTQRSGNKQGELGRRDVRFLQSWLLSCATAAAARV